MTQGLYQEAYEHDACGVGMVVHIHGGKSHELVNNALKVLENMEHRGAETRDKTGDGAGIMLQIPHEAKSVRTDRRKAQKIRHKSLSYN